MKGEESRQALWEAIRRGDIVKEDGSQWDLHSFAPEGRSADYQPGIILTSAMVHRLTGIPADHLAY